MSELAAVLVAAMTAVLSRLVLGPVRRRAVQAPATPVPDDGADEHLASMHPGRSLAGLRLSRDLRRWIPPQDRKLP